MRYLPFALALSLLATPVRAAVTLVTSYVDGQAGVQGLAMAQDVVVSPDGKHVYAVSEGDDAVVRFSRDATTGALTFVQAIVDGVAGVTGIEAATAVAISPDGATLYVTSGANDGAVAVFARNATSGALTFVEAEVNGQNNVSGLTVGEDVVVSPDGKHVYVLGFTPGAVLTFTRNETTGALTFLEKDEEGVNNLDGIAFATECVLSPDGKHLYVTGNADDAVTVFLRNTTTGRLSFVERKRDGVGGVDGIDGANAVAISDDGAHVYVGGADDDGLAVFARNANDGRLTFVQAYHEGVADIDGINSPADLAVTPDGAHVLVAASAESEIGVFARNPSTGGLTFVEAVGGGALGGVNTVRLVPPGNHLYTTARSSDSVSLFTVVVAPPTTSTSTTTTTSSTLAGASSSTTTTGAGTTTLPTTTTSGPTSSTAVPVTTSTGTAPSSTLGSTTTTSSTTPHSTTAPSSTTLSPTTTSPPSTAPLPTTTTLPDGGCPTGPTFDSLDCRLEALFGSTKTAALGTLRPKFEAAADKAHDRVRAARGICSFGKTKRARRRLARAAIQLARYGKRLDSRAAQRTVPADIRDQLTAEVNPIAADLTLLRRAVSCPIDS